MIRTLAFLMFASLSLMGDEIERAPVEPKSLPAPDQKVAPTKPAITRHDDGTLGIGKIRFDPKSRAIRFPAAINQNQGLLEFVLVHEKGKVHESLLVSDISATNLNLAFKLLSYKPSKELYLKKEEDGSLSSEFEEATEVEKKASRIRLFIEWETEGKKQRLPINRWITHATTEKEMPDSAWVYGGSFIYDGKFVAETSGDLIAVFLSNAALINYSGDDKEFDDVWLPHPSRVPAEGTKVEVIIEPFHQEAS